MAPKEHEQIAKDAAKKVRRETRKCHKKRYITRLDMAEIAGPNPAEPTVLFPIGDSENVRCGLSVTRIMAKKRHENDKKLHNNLRNSNEPDLSWQEAIDLQPEDGVDSGSEIYYFTDEDGDVHSREFLAEELLPADDEDLKNLLKRKLRYDKVEKLKPGTLDTVGVRSKQQPQQQEIALSLPKLGARPLDIRISSEVAPDLPIKEASRQSSDVVARASM